MLCFIDGPFIYIKDQTRNSLRKVYKQKSQAMQQVMATREEVTTRQRNEAERVRSKTGRPLLKQLTFILSSTDKYAKLRIFRMKVKNVFQNYSISQAEKVLPRQARSTNPQSGTARSMIDIAILINWSD